MSEFRGMPVVRAIVEKSKDDAAELIKKGITPKLSTVRVGEREDDISYERGITKRFTDTGVLLENITLPAECSQEELEGTLDRLAKDDTVTGILMFRPLPKHLDEKKAGSLVPSYKDVDCMTQESNAHLFMGDGKGYPPCTPQAVIECLDHYGIELKGKKVAVVGRSLVVGKPLIMLLLAKNATVMVCHTKTTDIAKECRDADIIVAAAGSPYMIDKRFVKGGQTVIDVGINVVDGKLCGDVHPETRYIVENYTPVPGGVGTVTTAVLLKHTVMGAEYMLNNK